MGQGTAMSEQAYVDFVVSSLAEGAERDALLERDVAALTQALELSSGYFCMVATPDGNERDEPAEDDDEEREDSPSEDEPARRETPL